MAQIIGTGMVWGYLGLDIVRHTTQSTPLRLDAGQRTVVIKQWQDWTKAKVCVIVKNQLELSG